jgi:hypothetical protein
MATKARIDYATRRCVRIALQGPKTPLAALATCLDDLRRDPSWDDRGVRQVRAKAFRRLILQPARYSHLERA